MAAPGVPGGRGGGFPVSSRALCLSGSTEGRSAACAQASSVLAQPPAPGVPGRVCHSAEELCLTGGLAMPAAVRTSALRDPSAALPLPALFRVLTKGSHAVNTLLLRRDPAIP